MKHLLSTFRPGAVPLPFGPLTITGIVAWVITCSAAFHASYLVPGAAFLILVFLFGMLRLSRVRTSRQAMNIGWVLGLLVYGPQLHFFWTVFGPGAATLWLVLAFWLGLFLVTQRQVAISFGTRNAALLAPVLWLGFEFFRSELYPLRFTWLTAGFTFSAAPLFAATLGVYGTGFVLMCIASAVDRVKQTWLAPIAGAVLLLAAVAVNVRFTRTASDIATARELPIAGVQMEFPSAHEALVGLEATRKKSPTAELFVLSEYTFDGPVPELIRDWCRKHRKYLIAGGKDMVDKTQFRNTAFVVGPDGDIVFQQVKAVPIQFFKDGLPALKQELWASPWGNIGLCICYDLSYSRVTDRLVKLGAQALIVPTMDMEEWGEYQHKLHARISTLRAAEHGLPIFRIASSGISQHVAANAAVLASVPFAQREGKLTGNLNVVAHGRIPPDRIPAWIATALTAFVVLLFAGAKILSWFESRRSPRTSAPLPANRSEEVSR